MQAIIPLLIFILYSAICTAEAWLEVVVIDLKDPRLENYKDLNRKEHARSLIYAVLVAMPFIISSIYYDLYFLLPAIVVNRRIFFDFLLKHFRERPKFLIEGSGPFDSFFRMVYGRKGGWYELITLLAVTIISIILTITKI